MRWAKRAYLAWAGLTYLLVFWKKGLDADNVTHLALLLVLAATLLIVTTRPSAIPRRPHRAFIATGVALAALGEGCYMISKPFQPSLLITAGMPMSLMARNYALDLAFTLPAYVVIFEVIWRLNQRFQYGRWEYILVFALGQALGDGNQTFLHAPGLLLLLPYVMVNYHAMNVVPYLLIERSLPVGRSVSRWRYAVGVVAMVAVYLVCGAILVGIARAAGIA
jgi:hypothetical protein